jgi:DUF971 family protein
MAAPLRPASDPPLWPHANAKEIVSAAPHPTEIKLHQKSRVLEISFSDGKTFVLPCEFLRVYSPSAEVRGHGPGQEVLQVGKKDVEISRIEAVGHYAIQPTFSDGHNTGIYSWDLLYDYGLHQDEMWQRYLERLAAAGATREAPAAQSPAKPN